MIATLIALIGIYFTWRIFKLNSKRDSVKLASDMTKYFLTDYIPAATRSYDYMSSKGIELTPLPVRLIRFTKNELSEKIYPDILKRAGEQYVNVHTEHNVLSRYNLDGANILEVFATPFIAGVADEETAFSCTGNSFCTSIEDRWLYYAFERSDKRKEHDYYSNTIALYNLWKSRIEKCNLEKSREELDRKIKENHSKPLRPIGT